MTDLASLFCSELSSARSPTVMSVAAGKPLSATLQSAWARGRAAHPGVVLDDRTFVRHLARCVAATGERVAEALTHVAAEDVYLACACLCGVRGAAERFESLCGKAVRMAVADLAARGAEREDVEQQLTIDLLVGRDGRPPKIGSYRGQAPLSRWAAVAGRRLALSMLKASAAERRARARASIATATEWRDPAIALLKSRFRPQFRRALEDAVAAIGERDRLLLRLHLVRGATTRRIAKMYQVTQPTASRWLDQARRRVLDEMVRLLRDRLKVSADEIQSMVTLMRSQIDISLSALLRTAG